MRPLEILLLLANLLTFLVLSVPRIRAVHWMTYSAFIGVGIAGAQALAEGARWQMIPAYVLSAAFFLVWILQGITGAGQPAVQRQASRLATVLGVGLSLLGLIVALALPIILPVFHFPRPTGPYAIGTLTYHWEDVDRPEIFTSDPADHREVMVQIWYPAKPSASSPHAPWIQDAGVVVPAFERLLLHVPAFTLSHLKYVTTNAIPSAAAAEDKLNYPVLIFLHGTLGFRQHNTFQIEELVSHGYIVAAIDQPYAAAAVVFPDGRQVEGLALDQLLPLIGQSVIPADPAPIVNGQAFRDGVIPYLAQDVSFTLDRLGELNQADPNGILTGRLDIQHTGIFGTSLGGIVGGEASLRDPRFQALLVEDAPMPADVVQAGLHQPTLWISRDAATMQLEGWSQAGPRGIDIHQSSMRTVFQNLPGDGYLVLMHGMFHINLTDFPLLSPLASLTGLSGPIDTQRAHSIINAYSLAFFDHELKGKSADLLAGPASQYPEVAFETRRRDVTAQKSQIVHDQQNKKGKNMNGYSIALFLHVVGALGFFVALGLEWTSLRHLRRAATTDQVWEWLRVPTEMGRLGMIAMLTLLVAGFYMMATTWHGVAWILVTLGAIVVMLPAMALTRQRMVAVERKVTTERGPVSPALHQLLHDPLLTISIQTRVAIALGIVFLMTVKPGLGASLLTIVVAIVLGLVFALPMPHRTHVQEGQGD